jgi:probable rRNA maturation factor
MSSSDGSTVTFRRAAADVPARAIAAFARKLEREVARGRAFDTLITGDGELRKLNREFRGTDYATDVLSFPSSEPGRASLAWAGQEAYPTLGDLAISVARARAQAKEYGHTTEQEIRILMLHGLLHLLGMDHENDDGRMARAEKRWRRQLGLPNGLIERVQP